MEELLTLIDGKEVKITNPHKLLWPEAGVTKLDYITYLLAVSPYLLPYTQDRLLMRWRYPDGPAGERIEEKSIPNHAPDWVARARYKDKVWIVLNDPATLAWTANREALELHVPFDRCQHKNMPTELVFDLDPPDSEHFPLVLQVAWELKQVLDSLGLVSVAKTSGVSGMQVHVPIEPRYTFEETRVINKFIADYMLQKLPDLLTGASGQAAGWQTLFRLPAIVERKDDCRPLFRPATPQATVSAPVLWEEVKKGFDPADFTVHTMKKRVEEKGDLFRPLTADKYRYQQSLDPILSFLRAHV